MVRQRGFNLVEIVVALGLSLALLAAFLLVLTRCRDQFATDESLARLEDAGRHALSVLVPDLEHAGFFGFAPSGPARFGRAGLALAEGAALAQPDASANVAPVAGLPAGAHNCGINFAVDVSRAVQGTNNTFLLAADCQPAASAGGARLGSDTLTVRHAALAPGPPHAGRVQVYAQRLAAFAPLELFADGRAPGPIDADREVRDLEVRTYYIANQSVDRPGWPALRVKALTESRGAAQFRDEEVMPGVEDLQVEFALAAHRDGSTFVRYVPPDSPLLRDGHIVAVRLWLRIRADSTEGAFRDGRALRYADATFHPTPFEATQRRVLIQRTVALRNSRSP